MSRRAIFVLTDPPNSNAIIPQEQISLCQCYRMPPSVHPTYQVAPPHLGSTGMTTHDQVGQGKGSIICRHKGTIPSSWKHHGLLWTPTLCRITSQAIHPRIHSRLDARPPTACTTFNGGMGLRAMSSSYGQQNRRELSEPEEPLRAFSITNSQTLVSPDESHCRSIAELHTSGTRSH